MNLMPQQLFVALGRVLLSMLFIVSGISKIGGYAGTAALMQAHGLPAALLPLVIAGEIGGGSLLAVGLCTRPTAALLALYSIAAIAIFHVPPHDHAESIIVLVELAMVGGLIDLAARGGGGLQFGIYVNGLFCDSGGERTMKPGAPAPLDDGA